MEELLLEWHCEVCKKVFYTDYRKDYPEPTSCPFCKSEKIKEEE